MVLFELNKASFKLSCAKTDDEKLMCIIKQKTPKIVVIRDIVLYPVSFLSVHYFMAKLSAMLCISLTEPNFYTGLVF